MTQEQYLAINSNGFEGDSFLRSEFEKVISENKIDVVVETGTFLGNTTKALASMAKEVHTVEVNRDNYLRAISNCNGIENIKFYLGSSEKTLPYIIDKIEKKSNILFFLDAHWNEYNPLLDELKVIKDKGLKPCIIIHDFKVPNTNFGYDSYKGQDYSIEWIESSIKDIYGEDLTYRYNTQCDGARRGVIFINC
jgi:predicted O-methyltransferase YrrM